MHKSRNSFDWDHARVFLAVAREGQMLAASRKLGLDQATVTRRITALEAELKVRLLDRTTTGSALTPAGQAFLERALRIESEFESLEAELDASAGAIEGTVRVGAPDGFGTLFLAGTFAPLLAAHPRLAVQLVPLPRSFSLSKREADIVVTVERPEEGRLKVRKLTDYSLSLYAAPEYLASAPPLRTLDDVAAHPVVTYVNDLLFSPALDFSRDLKLGAAPRRPFQCASVLGQIEAVDSGLGLGLLHDYARERHPRLTRVLEPFSVRRAYWLVTHAHVERARPVRAVLDHIADAVARAGDLFTPFGKVNEASAAGGGVRKR